MAKDLFSRYVWLVETIHQNGKLTFQEINEKWCRKREKEIPLKTFHNHRIAISDTFGIDILCNKSYQYYIENEEELENGNVQNWLISNFTISNLLTESKSLRDRIQLENVPSGQKFLSITIQSMRDEKTLLMEYQPHWNENSYTIEIEPYFVKLFKQIWYIIAHCPSHKKVKIYALDRIKSLSPTDHTFALPKDFDPQEFFLHNYGIIKGDQPPQTITIKVFQNQMKYWRALPRHHSQEEIETTPDYSVFSLFVSPTFDLMQMLLSQGEFIEVLSPEKLRIELKTTVEKMLNRYN
ncbi:MAG: helix-turn-helix transcriptional regulator [Bacteroidales bacterium]